jgi:hypothetical protein
MSPLKSTKLAIVAVCCLAFQTGGPAVAESWADRAGKMNAREISAEEAVERGQREEHDRRNKIAMRVIQPAMKSVDWNTDPTALPYVLYQFDKRTGLPVFVNTDGLDLAKDELFEYLVVYLTSHRAWSLNEKETDNLALFLQRGGTLFLDDCYNRGSPFADSVRPEVSKMIPGAEPIMLLEEDPKVKDVFKMAYQGAPWPGRASFENRIWQYFLLDGRPAVLFSPNDDGCGWEISTPPSASNPIGEGIGHGGDNAAREIFYQWATSALLFMYTH